VGAARPGRLRRRRLADRSREYDSEEGALAGGETPESIAEFLGSLSGLPGMTAYEGYEIYQPGAQPCFIADVADVAEWSDAETEQIDPDARCPEGGDVQPRFRGTEGLYNSGFIAPQGARATRQAREEIDADAELALRRVEEVRTTKAGKVGELPLPLAGRDAEDEFTVIINEFLPREVEAAVGEPVTWTVDGIDHTISFNVPKYFPIFTVKEDGEVVWQPKSYEPVGWSVPEQAEPEGEDEEPPPRAVDVGDWNGSGGFHSSGALSPGDTFTVTFTKAGSYPFACVLHPQMVGTVEVA
jgi:plastocyanin